jgi:hypothetical protein
MSIFTTLLLSPELLLVLLEQLSEFQLWNLICHLTFGAAAFESSLLLLLVFGAIKLGSILLFRLKLQSSFHDSSIVILLCMFAGAFHCKSRY